MDMAEFLAARLDEDEAAANAAIAVAPAPWQTVLDHWVTDKAANGFIYADFASHRPALPHIARHDPARVLREVEAKRALLKLADEADLQDAWGIADGIRRAVGAVYSDHPDYQPGRKP